MKNLASLSIVLCLFSCSPELELVDWIDRAEEACQCENLTKGSCMYVDVKFTIREGKIESVLPPWISGRDDLYEQTEEWFEGPC